MPRDTPRRAVRSVLRDRAASPATAFAAFSTLVAISVAVSSGIDPAADAVARGGQGAASGASEATAQRQAPGWSLMAAGRERPRPPAGPLQGDRTSSPVRDGAAGDGSWRAGAGRGEGGKHSASAVRPGRKAPRLYHGELPVNTIIAPASPGAVLPGGTFGWRIAPDRGGREFHNGTDISAGTGVPVVAALDGRVTAVFWDVWGGNRVEVVHANGLKTTYSHLDDVRVAVGDRLAASEQLGTVGATGVRVTGPHLHFETWVDGKAVDPQSFDWIDGMRVVPASRAKYSLEVPVPEGTEDDVVAPSEPSKQKGAEQAAKESEKKDPEKKDSEKNEPVKQDLEKKDPEKNEPVKKDPVKQDLEKKEPVKKESVHKESTQDGPVPPAPTKQASPGNRPATQPEAPEQVAPAEPVVPAIPVHPVSPAAPVEPAVPPAPSAPVAPVAPAAPAEPVVPVVPAPPAEPAVPPAVEPGVAPVAVPDAVRDTDGDGILDVEDPDLDADGIPDELDGDLDGDGIANGVDPDMDGDGLRNEVDPDLDGDGRTNGEDEHPGRPAPKGASDPGATATAEQAPGADDAATEPDAGAGTAEAAALDAPSSPEPPRAA